MKTTIKTVLFDIDGTLDDSNDAHARSWVDAFAEHGFTVSFERVRPLIGMGSDKLIPQLDLGLDAAEEPGKKIVERRKAIFLERYIPTVKPFPGARDLVLAMRERGMCCIVASSASEAELEPLLKIAGVESLFEHAMSPQEVEKTKPDPDIIKAALAWSGTAAEQTVMIGDSRFDMEAAVQAGVRAIGLRCGGSSDGDLSGAHAIFDTPQALLQALRDATLDELLEAKMEPAPKRQ